MFSYVRKERLICQSENVLGTCINLLMAVPSVCSLSYSLDHQHFPFPQAITVLSLYQSFTNSQYEVLFLPSLHYGVFCMHLL